MKGTRRALKGTRPTLKGTRPTLKGTRPTLKGMRPTLKRGDSTACEARHHVRDARQLLRIESAQNRVSGNPVRMTGAFLGARDFGFLPRRHTGWQLSQPPRRSHHAIAKQAVLRPEQNTQGAAPEVSFLQRFHSFSERSSRQGVRKQGYAVQGAGPHLPAQVFDLHVRESVRFERLGEARQVRKTGQRPAISNRVDHPLSHAPCLFDEKAIRGGEPRTGFEDARGFCEHVAFAETGSITEAFLGIDSVHARLGQAGVAEIPELHRDST